METKKYIVVIGGMNLDLAGLSGDVYRPRDSNIGEIEMTVGGVGQNIAQNLTRLNVPTYLITVYGNDHFGNILTQECGKNSIYLDYSECIIGKKSSTYLYVADNKGDMVAAVNDMSITENMTPKFLQERIDFINGATLCVIDGNVSAKSIRWLADHCTVPIFADPVSTAKASRFQDILEKIDTFKPNELEAELLTGIKITDEKTANRAAGLLNKMGVKNVFISLGAKGILCSGNGETILVPIIPSNITSVNGAGDCSMATIVWARFFYKESVSLRRVGELAQAAASLTVEVAESVSTKLSVEAVLKRANTFKNQ
ncbi:carbohydrate kinase family protein [Lacrimispora sp.]|uniref:carbohydrate kinase family protein n=1 Tax=Lacrimispora sp. TaxID=2719234 RepID=UPI00289BBA4E|nr:carbohydrate kinase family protein [Lacrimispora sp.]